MPSSRFLPVPCLALVSDRTLCEDLPLAEKVAQAVAGGANLVQLREKDLPAGELLQLAQSLRRITAGRARLLVNDRLDVALAADADGVHLPERGLPVAEARRLLGREHIIGRSVHSLEEARRAQEEGADYVQVGTIYPSRSHPDAAPAGPRLIEEVARQLRIPVLAIGGLTAENVAEVMRSGAAGVAVISAILAAPSPQLAAEALWRAIQTAWAALSLQGRRQG